MTPDKNKDIANLKVAAVGAIVRFTSKEPRGRGERAQVFSKGHHDEYSLTKCCVSKLLTLYSEYKINTKP